MPPSASRPEKLPSEARRPKEGFIVGIGASAGGLESISELIKAIPADTAASLIIVQHLDPGHESLLVELLQRVSNLPVQWLAQGDTIGTRHIYVAPPHKTVSLEQGAVQLREADRGGGIDPFFRSLATGLGDRAICVILSGSGSDGAAGLKAVKGAGGICFAQLEKSAAFPQMPRAAIDTGCVDRVLPPAAIGEEIVRLSATSPDLWERIGAADQSPDGIEAPLLVAIFRQLLLRTGIDFAAYKQNTIKRRLVRRMILAQAPSLADYTHRLQRDRPEVDALCDSLLINVTEFFRDPPTYDFLRESVLSALVARPPGDPPIRVWVPGCATGEEAYSIAILIRELQEDCGSTGPVQIFGTDVSEAAVAFARAGHYAPHDLENVSPERLRRFFVQTERGYAVQKSIRDTCVFARQNVVADSPFSRLDLISCRNLMIYLGPQLQQSLVMIFHYALRPGGHLLLGTSESVGGFGELFQLVDRRFRIYQRKPASRRPNLGFPSTFRPAGIPETPKTKMSIADHSREPFDVMREADRVILGRFTPAAVVVNEDLEILQFRGDVTPYLAPVEGRASLNLIKMARDGLGAELQSLIQQAKAENVRVRRTGVTIMQGDALRQIELEATPISPAPARERYYLVLFTTLAGLPPAAPSPPAAPGDPHRAQLEQLRKDLQATRTFLQSAIEGHESANQELRAANEEIQSSNEELQSTNEELETAKEELQSTNEELTTVNQELHSRQMELVQLNNDLSNLINSVHLPIIILGHDMRIRRFTPMAEKVLNVIPSDIGRPLTDLNIRLKLPNLPALVGEVIDSLVIKVVEAEDSHGRWFSVRIRPYRTSENRIDGVVITLIDVDESRRNLSAVEAARDFARAVLQSTREPMAVLGPDLSVEGANDRFYSFLKTTREHIEGKPLSAALGATPLPEELRNLLDHVLPHGPDVREFPIQFAVAGAPVRTTVSARRISSGNRDYPRIILTLKE